MKCAKCNSFVVTMNRRELDISKYQKRYRCQANIQSISNREEDKRKKLEKAILRVAGEIVSLTKTLHVVQSKGNLRQSDQFIERLEKYVKDIKRHEKLIEGSKRTLNQLKQQIIHVDCDHVHCERHSISDDEYSTKLTKARKTVTILDSRLEVRRKHENKFKGHNADLLIVIRDAIIGRNIFNGMWTGMVTRLNLDRKMLITMVERALLAFRHGKQMCYQIDVVRQNDKQEKRTQIAQMLDVMKSIEQDAIKVQFFRQKARVIIQNTNLDDKGAKQRAKFKEHNAAASEQCKNICRNIRQYANECKTQAAIDKYNSHKRQFFAYCLYLNDIEHIITRNGRMLANMQETIEFGQRNADTLPKKQLRLDKLRSRLIEERCQVQQREQKLSAIDEMLQRSYEKINSIFMALNCVSTSTGLVNDFENNTANENNYVTYLSTIDARIKQMISFIYYCDREDYDEWSAHLMTVKNVEVAKSHEIESPRSEVIVPQCAECAEAEDLARPDIDTPFDRHALREHIRQKLPQIDLHSRVHQIEECPRPNSRALLSKWV